jgi:arsenate reductase
MTITLFGIPNCDTVKKSRAWLADRGLSYAFHDYKKAGVDTGKLAAWVDQLGWEKLLNRNGTTFRKLPDSMKADLDAGKAIMLMTEHPSMIKRPVVEYEGGVLVGFKADDWDSAF